MLEFFSMHVLVTANFKTLAQTAEFGVKKLVPIIRWVWGNIVNADLGQEPDPILYTVYAEAYI